MDNQTIFNELRRREVANETKSGKEKNELSPEAKTDAATQREKLANTIIETLRTSGIQLGE